MIFYFSFFHSTCHVVYLCVHVRTFCVYFDCIIVVETFRLNVSKP